MSIGCFSREILAMPSINAPGAASSENNPNGYDSIIMLGDLPFVHESSLQVSYRYAERWSETEAFDIQRRMLMTAI